MYEQFFNLNVRPFTTTPYVKHYFATHSFHKALSQCQTSIQRGAGTVMVVGHLGTGKSLLLNLLADLFREQYFVIHLGCARLEKRHELLQSILFHLEQPYRDRSEVELRLALIDFLKPGGECPRGILLLVDEAHHLSPELLDELRLITNIVQENQPRVRVVVAGGYLLEENLTTPKLEPFNQRIVARCFLDNLVRDETFAYVCAHIDRAGGDGRAMFTTCALESIHETSGGCPRVINQLCDQAMMLAASAQSRTIDQGLIREAWADIQCIPEASLPGSSHSIAAGAGSSLSTSAEMETAEMGAVVEFGELQDEPLTDTVEPTPGNGEQQVEQAEPAFFEPLDSIGHDVTTERIAELGQEFGIAGETVVQDGAEQAIDSLQTLVVQGLVDHRDRLDDDSFSLNVAEQNIKSLEVNQDHMQLLEEVYGVGPETVHVEGQVEGHVEGHVEEQPACADDEGPTRNPLKYESPIWVDPGHDQPLHLFQEAAVESWDKPGSPMHEPLSATDNTAQAADELRLTDDELHELDSVASAVERLERDQSSTAEREFENQHSALSERPGMAEGVAAAHLVDDETLDAGCADLPELGEAERLLEQIRHFTERDQLEGTVETGQVQAVSEPVLGSEWSDQQQEMESGLAGPPRGDDRDMLVISQSEQLNARAAEAVADMPHVHEQPSTGHAVRMDYHQLFEQLRNA